MKKQFDLPKSEEVFNLASEHGQDPWRVERERIAEQERRELAIKYQRHMQRALELCPGFVACDAPSSDDGRGRVSVSPAHVAEAALWLKRRFHTSENLELSQGDSLVFEIAPRIRRATGRKRRVKVAFGPVIQYELALA